MTKMTSDWRPRLLVALLLLAMIAPWRVAAGLTGAEKDTIELFERAAPSVVYITSVSVRRDFFGRNAVEVPAGTGSGFIWDRDGHIVTNYHVIQNADRAGILPTRRDGRGNIVLGDVIAAIDGDAIDSSGDLLLALERRKPGDKVRITVLRAGVSEEFDVVLDAYR